MRERLQKIISAAGLMSRRAAEEYISAGRVTVNGRKAELGMSADPRTDTVEIDGVRVPAPADLVYIMLNKPRGYITTMSDERGRRTVTELVGDLGVRVYPVGRLDLNSEGLLLMTNDGEAAKKLTAPSHNVLKLYRVKARGEDLDRALLTLRGELLIDGRAIRARSVRLLSAEGDAGTFEIAIAEGRNRQIRRMCDLAGLEVKRLVRTAVGELRLGSLRTGNWRHLTEREIDYVRSIR